MNTETVKFTGIEVDTNQGNFESGFAIVKISVSISAKNSPILLGLITGLVSVVKGYIKESNESVHVA